MDLYVYLETEHEKQINSYKSEIENLKIEHNKELE